MQNSSFCDIFDSELSDDDKSPGIARNKNPMTGMADNVCDDQQEPLCPVFETPFNKQISRVQVISSPEMGVHNTKNPSTIGLLSSTPEPSDAGENKGSVFGDLFDIDDAFGSLINLMDKTNVSWTSSMATPVQDVKSTSFNTEERKVLMPVENDVEEISSVCPANQALLTEETENKSLRETFLESDKKCENSPSGSPVCTGNSSNSSWYWADTQTLICRTPHRKSSSRKSKQLKLNSPNTTSSIVQTPKPEYFLFDGNSFPDTNSQIDNLIDPCKQENSNENEMKRNGVIKSRISEENPLNIERNREQNEINNPSRYMGITQQFSPDLSASMLEEVCLATELLSAEKNNVETQGSFLKESFTANFEHKKVIQSENVSRGVLKSSVKFKSNIQTRNNENLNKDNESSKSELHSEEKRSQPDFLGKHSIDDVFDVELSSPINNLEKFRVANRINSTLYNNSRAEPVSCKTFNNSEIFENASKSALFMETGEIFRCQSETNSRKISTSENYPKGFVPFSHLHHDNKTHNSAFGSNEDKLPPTQVSKEMSVRSNDIYLDELHTTNQKNNCHKSTKLLQNENNLKGFLKGSKKRLRESEMDVCSKLAKIGSDTSLKEENNILCSTSCKDDIHKETIASVNEPQNKTLEDPNKLSIKTNFQNQRLKEESTPVDEMDILIRLLGNKDNSAEKIQTLNRMDNILQQHNELQLSQDIFADNENIVDSVLEFQKERGNQNSSNLKGSCVTFINSDDICDGYDKENSKLHSYTALKIGNRLPIAFLEKCVTDEMLNGNVMKSSGNHSVPTRDLKWENKLDCNVTFPNQGLEEDIFYDNPHSEDSSLKLHERTSFSQKVNVCLSPTLLVTKPTSENSKNILQTNELKLIHKPTSSSKSDLIKHNSAKNNSDHLPEAVNHNEIESRGSKRTTLEKHEESYSNADEEIEHIFSHSNDYDSKEKEQFSSDLCKNKESLNENNKKKGQNSNFHQDYNNLFPKTNKKPIMHAISNVYEDIIRRNKISHDKIAKDTLNLDANCQELESNASRKRSYNDIQDKKQHILDCHSEEPNKKKQNFRRSKSNIKVSPLYDARNTISFVPDTGQEELNSELTKAESSILPRNNERLSIRNEQSQYNVSEISMENCKMNIQNTDIQISEERCTSPVLSGLSQSSRSIKVSAKSLTKRRNKHMKKKLEQNLCQEKVNVNAKSEGYNSEKIITNEQKYIEGHNEPLPPNPEKLNKNCVIHKFSTVRSENISVSTDNLEKRHNFESCDVSIPENTMELQVNNRIKPKLTVFSTNNKNVNVSEKILEKRPTKYESCDYSFSRVNLEHSANHKVDLKFVGSPSARDKTLKVSDAAIKETVETFEGCELSTSTENLQNCSAKKQIHFKFDGFSTASGKNIKVSEDALKRAQKIFEGCEHVYSGENLLLSAQDGVVSKFGRISTNSSKSIKVSEPALKRNEKIFEDGENCSNPKYFECPIKHVINSKFGGFSTASGKAIKFSDAAIKKAEKIFEGCEISTSEKSLEGPAKFGGFSTAGGKKINISEVSLKRAHKIFDVCENSPSGVNLEDPAKLGGLSTVGGKNINISETVLKGAEKIFEGCENCPSGGNLERPAKLGGFSTAGGKNIIVSETALKRAQKIFEGCENSPSVGILEHSAKLGGFSTAGGKNINISKTVLKRAEKIFEGCENCPSGGNLERPAKLSGFSTAGGKNINISETALKGAVKIFESCENSPSVGILEHSVKLGGFSTAGGKNINVSETVSEKRGEKIFEGCEKITSAGNMYCPTKQEVDSKFGDFTMSVGNNTKVSDSALNIAQKIFEGYENPTSGKILNCQAKFGGFSTASGKNITVSDAAVKAVKKIFEDCEISTSAEKWECLAKHEVDLKFSGFSRTSGNNKNVSEAALGKSKQIFEECEISTSEENPKCLAKFAGFSTAGGKNTNFSEAALSRAQKIFKDCDNSPSGGNLEHQAKFGGFCTAGGRNINISETALKRAKKIFEGCEKSTSAENLDCSTRGQEVSKFGGFSTARGKSINVSEAALNKARKIFEACEKSTSAENLVCATKQHVHSKFGGLSTCGGNNVKVSDPELNKAQKILENGENPTSEGNTEKCPTKFGGFSTAAGKNMSVSEAALNRARKIFEECENSTSRGNLECPSKFVGCSTAGGKSIIALEDDLKCARKTFDGYENCGSVNNLEFFPKPLLESNVKGFSSEISKNEEDQGNLLKYGRKINDECVATVSERDGVNDLGESRLSLKLQDFGSKGSGSPSMCDINQSKCSKADFLDTKSNKKDTVINVTATAQASDAITYSTLTTSSNISPINISSGIEILADKSIQISCTLEESLKEFESFLPMTAELNVSLSKDSKMLYEDAPQIQSLSSSVSTSHSKKVTDQENTLTEEKHYLNANDADIEEICHDFLNSSFCTRLSEISHSAGTSVSRKLSFPEYENRELQTSYGAKDSTSRYSTTSNSFNFLTTGNIGCQRRPPLCSTSLLQDETISQEVRECTSALLADEEEEEPGGGGTGAGTQAVPAWAHTMLSCPEMVHDRLDAPSPLLCHGEPADASDTPPSPVLGRSDRFGRHSRTRASRRKSKIDKNMNLSGSLNSSPSEVQFGTPEAPIARATSTPIAHPIEQKAPPSSFKVPYKSLTTPTGKQVAPAPPPSSSQPRDARPAASKPPGRTRVPPPPPRARVPSTRPAETSAPAATATPEVAEGRARAAAAQEEAWRARSKGGASAKRACHGSLQLRKRQERAKRLSLRAATRGLLPARHSRKTLLCYGMKECVVDVSAENAAQFKFHAWEFYSSKLSSENIDGIPVGDGAMLIWDAASKAGVAEVTRAFLSSSGVEPSLIPHGWVENHFRWLVWKLACMERSFPHLFAGRCLTPNVLLLQLRFRYDRELDACERPALRRILEKDDAVGKRLILCVVAVLPLQQADRNKESEKNENSAVSGFEDPKSGSDCELLLTDGWYSILSNVDQEMCCLVRNGQVSVGTKLITYGAELLNCNEGCSPLEVSSTVRLKLHTNSTRRACWDARLGFQKFAGAFPVHLNTILPNGGLVSCVKVIIARLYPVLYFEKVHGEKAILRTERCEMQIAAQFEQQKLQRIEQLFSQEKARYYKENKKKRRASAQELALISSGQELCEILDSDPDPSSIQALLTEEQRRIVLDYQQGYRDQIVQELQTRIQQQMNEDHSATRNVTPVLKVRCLDVRTRDSSKCAILSIWRPSEETTHLLKEGCVIKLYSVNALGIRRGNLQLSTGRQTRYCPVPLPRPIPYFQRRCFNFDEIALRNFQPPFNELDTVGLIVHIGIGPHSSSRFESVYLADADMKIICVSFWGGIKEYGWEDLLQTKTFIAASNLQWRVNSGRQKIINVYASEFTTFAKSPKQQYLKEVLEDLKCNIKINLSQFVTSCRELILSRLRGEITSDTSVNLDKSTTPLPENHSFLTEREGMNPDKDMQDTPVRKRLRKLEQFDNPPPISPLNLLSRGEALKKQFKVPSKTTESESCDLNSESPPLSLDDPG